MNAKRSDARNPFDQDPWARDESPKDAHSHGHAAQHDEEKQSKLPFLIVAVILAAAVFFIMRAFGF